MRPRPVWSRYRRGETVLPATAIQTISYDRQTRSLRVVLQTGWHYVYRHVPEETFAALAGAYSRDEFCNRYIRGQFQFLRYPPVAFRAQPGRVLQPPAGHLVHR